MSATNDPKDSAPNEHSAHDQASPLAEFEGTMAELEAIVEKLETGDISLEESLTQFEQGIAMIKKCQSALAHAELRVDQLLESDGEHTASPFQTSEYNEKEG